MGLGLYEDIEPKDVKEEEKNKFLGIVGNVKSFVVAAGFSLRK